MLEIRGRLDLGEEPRSADDRCQLRLQDLERDLALVLEVIGKVHRGHAALIKFTLDAIAAFEGRV